ncbi:AAA family ATPase [Spirosoma litoris]
MLRSLEIRNYRNLRHLTIEKLGRVNLLVGKNNTGKTSVLEAISILVHKANLQWISQIFEERGEDASRTSTMGIERRIEYNLELLSGLFYGREYSTEKQASILISSEETFLSLRFIYYVKEEIQDEEGSYSRIVTVNSPNESEGLGIEIIADKSFQVITLDRNLSRPLRFGSISENVQFVRSSGVTRESNGRLWDKITSPERNKYVEDALRLVEPDVVGLRYVLPDVESYGTRKKDERIGRVQLKGSDKPVYLRSMGDGINRILTIILAMVNCENGYLLIDEFENGLHYSVQEKLWEIIFYLAERLNIQVFATTHSNDTIKAFGEVSNSKSAYNDAQLIRLRNIKGEISAVLFNAQDVEIATETDYLDLR